MKKEIERPSKEIIEFFKKTPTAFVSDAEKKLGLRAEMLYMKDVYPMFPLSLRKKDEVSIAGPAITFEMGPHTATYEYTEFPYKLGTRIHFLIVEKYSKPGDIVVIDAKEAKLGMWGGYMTQRAAKLKVGGMVTDGYIRDADQSREWGVPLFSRGKTMISYVYYLNPISEMTPVHCGGALVKPGDIIVGDTDGVVVVPHEKLDEIIEVVKINIDAEKKISEWLNQGKSFDYIYKELHPMKYIKGR